MINEKRLESFNIPRHKITEVTLFEIEKYREIDDIEIIVFPTNGSQARSYQGVCNYSFWGPRQATPYKSLHGQDTIEFAIRDAFSGIKNFDEAEYPNECVFFVRIIGNETIYINGNGEQVSLNTVHEEHNKFRAMEKKNAK